ncbi:hypothetical protein D9C10_01185 [Bacillus subtilis subsp. subtilis]|nr:hypothetical protein D9C10_01185 [Bacillus subtilis subsp. subtilis]
MSVASLAGYLLRHGIAAPIVYEKNVKNKILKVLVILVSSLNTNYQYTIKCRERNDPSIYSEGSLFDYILIMKHM